LKEFNVFFNQKFVARRLGNDNKIFDSARQTVLTQRELTEDLLGFGYYMANFACKHRVNAHQNDWAERHLERAHPPE